MHIERILVLEDSPEVANLVTEVLLHLHYTVRNASTIQEARSILQSSTIDLVLADVRLPDGDGIEFLREIQAEKDPPMFIMMSGYGTIETATESMRLGALDFLVKPFRPEQLEVALKRSENWKRLAAENTYWRSQASEHRPQWSLIGKSAAMLEVQRLIRQIGPTNATVLISGESGTGKEVVARSLFEESPRFNRPFIKLNCAAIPENLIESELFGHEKGAFTGAVNKRLGRFELADGGTLLLDEISDLPLLLQVKLLRVLQEREFERVGGSQTLSVDVRILAATNRDLKAAVTKGKFREDLFYRLNVVPIHLPPLRQRPEDVPLLLAHYLKHFAIRHGKPEPVVAPEALEAIQNAPWPGNIRELQNATERAVILAEPGKALTHMDFGLVEQQNSIQKSWTAESELSIDLMERRTIKAALERTQGNKTRAAKLLGISIRALQYKLQAYNKGG